MPDQFWTDNAYDDNDLDRAIICVGLKVEKDGVPVYHKTYVMDAYGDQETTAMACLVSNPVSLAVEAVADGKISAGVSAAPDDADLVEG